MVKKQITYRLLISFILLFLFFYGNAVFAIEKSDSISILKSDFNQKYGLNELLHNGRYFYPESNIKGGSPFWGKDSVHVGDISIEGKTFSNQSLLYNLFSKEVILLFTDNNGARKYITVDVGRIDSFSIVDNVFILNKISQIQNNYLQVIYDGNISCYLSWSIEKYFQSTGIDIGQHYAKPESEKYVVLGNEVYRIRKKRDLLNILPQSGQIEVKNYMKVNKIRWKKITNSQLYYLLAKCEKIIE